MIKKFLKKINIYINNYKLKIKNNSIVKTIQIGNNFKLGKYCTIHKNVMIGKNVKIGDYTYISSKTIVDSNVIIGKYCSIASNVFIAPGVHKYSYVTTHPILFNPYWRKKMKIEEKSIYDNKIGKEDEITIIGNDVWIALNAIIMRGVKVGDGAIIGAGAIVTKDVEPYSIVVGNPAKHIKYRFEKDDIEKIENMKIKWWDLSPKELEKIFIHMYNIKDYIKYYN